MNLRRARRPWLLSLLLLPGFWPALHAEPVELRVLLLGEQGEPLEGAVVRSGPAQFHSNALGEVQLQLQGRRLYRLDVDAPGYFGITHTFSEQERLHWGSEVPVISAYPLIFRSSQKCESAKLSTRPAKGHLRGGAGPSIVDNFVNSP